MSTVSPAALPTGSTSPIRVVLVTNIPAPYRIPVFEAVAGQPDIHFHAIYCSEREPDRSWDLPPLNYSHEFLPQRILHWRGRYIHVNRGTWAALKRQRPDVVIISGFNPTHLAAYAYARLHGAAVVPMTDGTKYFEDLRLTAMHRQIRRHIFARSRAFLGACEGSFELYRDYGISDDRMFKSHLCAQNARFAQAGGHERNIDFLFSGRFVSQKQPRFAIEVAAETAKRLNRRVSLAMLGDGPLLEDAKAAASALSQWVDVTFPGFISQQALPAWFGRARIFLFPTEWDPWGVVANEASASSTPVIVSPLAGVSGELIQDGVNGRVLPLDQTIWAEAAERLLTDHNHWQAMSEQGLQRASEYTYDNAAQGIAEASRLAAGKKVLGINPLVLPMSLRKNTNT